MILRKGNKLTRGKRKIQKSQTIEKPRRGNAQVNGNNKNQQQYARTSRKPQHVKRTGTGWRNPTSKSLERTRDEVPGVYWNANNELGMNCILTGRANQSMDSS